jgi:hypothetical protein
MITRRSFIGNLFAAPAVLKLGLWMPIKPLPRYVLFGGPAGEGTVWEGVGQPPWERMSPAEITRDIEVLFQTLVRQTMGELA